MKKTFFLFFLSAICFKSAFGQIKWIDKTLPSGLTREKFIRLNNSFNKLPESEKKIVGISVVHDIGDREVFWVESDEGWVQITAECRKVADVVYVFIALTDNYGNTVINYGYNDGYMTDFDAEQVGNEFNSIYTTVREVFGEEPETGLNGQSRVTILLYDIDDDYENGTGKNGYTAGYFFGVDTWTESYASSNGYHSNERKIIYIDTYPLIENNSEPDTDHSVNSCYSTIAHEFQHLIHNYRDSDEETWLDEACATLAQHVCGYEHSDPTPFANDWQRDDPLTNWGGQLIDYAQVSLFALYLYEKYGEASMIRVLVENQLNSVESIDSVLEDRGYYDRFYDVFEKWSVALCLDDTAISDGIYGFSGIDLTDFPFMATNSHSSFPASGSGSVIADMFEIVEFTNGIPDWIYYSSSGGYDGFVIVMDSVNTVSRINENEVNITGLGNIAYKVMLVTPGQQSSYTYNYNTSSEYTETLNDFYEPNNSRESAYRINFIDTVWNTSRANIENSDDVDWYSFETDSPKMLTVICNVTSQLDVKIVLYRGEYMLFSEDMYYAGNDEQSDDYSIPESGTYYIGIMNADFSGKITAVQAETGSYRLTVILTGDESSVDLSFNSLPHKLLVHPPYPNPFNPYTTIRYELPVKLFAEIVIYDITGRKVAVLDRGYRNAGLNHVSWNAETVASGLYFYRISVGKESKSGKLILVK